tara:strand:+ start:97 stop:411 length:315 start_codon:yes stop_codon:yes gene_type:complete
MSKFSSFKKFQLITESFRKFLKEDEDIDYAEAQLTKMEPARRIAFIEATRKAIRDHLHPSEEGVIDYVLDRAGQPGAEHLAPLVSLFLDDPGVLFDLREKLDLG